MFHKKTCKGIHSCCCGQCGMEGRECENGKKQRCLNGLKEIHYDLLSPPVFCCHPFLKFSLQSASLLWRTSRFGVFFFFIFECCFSSFLNLKDLIFYNNSQMHTSNSDFLSKHTWTYRKIKICFDSHRCFSFFLFQITLNCLEILLVLL